jgi:hypothetical protein
VEARVQTLITSYDIHGGQTVTAANFSPSFLGITLPLVIPQLLHAHLSMSDSAD